MILTEADLHAYNRGELSPEATRLLESDPLAMEDAARLRAISAALRSEATIPVTGRAETLERLRVRNVKGIGVPRWVWAVGVVCVFGAVAVSLPPQTIPGFRVQRVVYDVPESPSGYRPLSTGAISADTNPPIAGTMEPSSAGAVSSRPESKETARGPGANTARSSPPTLQRARAQAQNATLAPPKTAISIQTPDLVSEGRRIATEIQALGGRIESDRTRSRSRTIRASLDPSRAEILRDRLLPQTENASRSGSLESQRAETPSSQDVARTQARAEASPRPSPGISGAAKAYAIPPPSQPPLSRAPESTVEILLTSPPSARSAPPSEPSSRSLLPWLGAFGAAVLFLGGAWGLRLRSRRHSS